jgi:methanogenic corrinoid protein MtbC1
VKKVRGRPYGYLVENRWDPKRGQARQRVVRYLGRLDRVDLGSIPKEHRTPAVVAALERGARAERSRRASLAEGLRPELAAALVAADRPRARRLVRSGVRSVGLGPFLSEVLAGAMHDIGEGWSSGRLSVSDEHLATGIAESLLAELNAAARAASPGGPEVVLCVPDGEQHTLALLVAEGLLLEKGYRPVNVGSSAPARSTVEFVRTRRPAGVLISVTHTSRLDPARAMARQMLRDRPALRVAIGGQAIGAARPGRAVTGVDEVAGPMPAYLAAWPEAVGP